MNTQSTDMQVPQTLSNVDRRDLPEWGEAEDGRSVKLVPDDKLRQDFAEWQAGACQHERKLIHERPNAAGSIVYVTRCTSCGIRLSQAMPHDVVADFIAQGLVTNKRNMEAFENQESRYSSHRREALDAIANAAAVRQQPARRAEYSEHLASSAWREMRVKVMRRAGDACEGCLDAPAEEVHHKTYAHVRSEFAFELVALCSDCHTRLHSGAV